MMKRVGILVMVLLVLVLAGCGEKETAVMTEQEISPLAVQAAQQGVEFSAQTEDYKDIAGTLYDVGAERNAILLHMMGKDRTTWDNFVPVLINAGYNVVAIDLRGHGESSGDWHDFVKQEFSDTYLDVKSAKEHLDEQGMTGDVVIIGASIGANAALKYAVEDTDVKQIVMLSPGLDYRGMTTKDVISSYTGSMMLVVSENDIYARQSGTELFASARMPEEKKNYVQYTGKAHGTDMFAENPLADDIVDWLKTQ
ncbi:alpha/beta hydrolase [Thermoproteota archaeon]